MWISWIVIWLATKLTFNMKKILLLASTLLLLTGCSQPVSLRGGESLEASKEKIVSSETIKRKIDGKMEEFVSYKYISDEVSKKQPYWDKEGSPYSSAEILPNNNRTIAFYAEPIFYRDKGVIYDIKEATTTKEAFQVTMAPTIFDSFRSHLFDTAVATTTETASTTYTPSCANTATVLLVAPGGGSGGGGATYNAGGGGGQVISTTTALTVQSYTITIGVGGLGADSASGGDGQNTTAFGFTANGGKGAKVGAPDGTGGTSGSGKAGGTPGSPGAGGGGGDSANGGNGSGSTGGNGGQGTSSTISGTDTCYGGGGAGASGGVGRCGGGNQGAVGTANSGGGEGANSYALAPSGIVIIAEGTCAATPTTTSAGTCISMCEN